MSGRVTGRGRPSSAQAPAPALQDDALGALEGTDHRSRTLRRYEIVTKKILHCAPDVSYTGFMVGLGPVKPPVEARPRS